MGHRIFYTGFENEMDKFYTSIDLLVLPSQLPDPLPTVVLEAMQYGIPVVATAKGGALEMIKANETGIFIPMNDVTISANNINVFIQNENHLAMKEKCIQRVNQYFSIEAFENSISNLLHL